MHTLTEKEYATMAKNFIDSKAFIIVDAQCGFMPANENETSRKPGFGELGVTGGDRIIPNINTLTRLLGERGVFIATTQDWHPLETAHFSKTPNFINTWPVHCVANTPGAALHPDLDVAKDPTLAERFIKGDTACTSPENDTSYSGALAYNPTSLATLPDRLRERQHTDIYVAGLALGDGDHHKLCVDSTAYDLQTQGFNVSLITDATEAVVPENQAACFLNLGRQGIRLMTTAQVIEEIESQS